MDKLESDREGRCEQNEMRDLRGMPQNSNESRTGTSGEDSEEGTEREMKG
jgi:hypothetical protein